MINLLQKSLNWFDRDQHQPQKRVVVFSLFLDKMLVGQLRWDGEQWAFTYSQEFASQENYAPITDFPDTSRTYLAKDLWPFFALRIPSRTQAAVKQWLNEQAQTEVDDARMLEHFGRETASNPFILQPAS